MNGGVSIPEPLLVGVVFPLTVLLVGALFTFLVKTSNQNAIQRDRDARTNGRTTDSDRTDDLIDNLEKRIEEQAGEIRELRTELRNQQREHARQIEALSEKLQSAETRLGIARTQIKSLEDKSP